MENGTAEAEPADVVANDVASAAVEDAPASESKLEVAESVEDDASDHPEGEAVSGLPSPSLTNEDEGQVQLEGTEVNLADSTSLDPEVPVDSPSAVGTVDDSETSGMEMGSSEAEDVISPEESDPSLPKGSEETPGIDEKDFGDIQGSENLNDAIGENAGGSLTDESVDSAQTCAPAFECESLVDTENTEDSEIPLEKGADNSPVEGDAAASVKWEEETLNNGESELITSLVTDDTAPEGTLEEPRDDNLAVNAMKVISDVPTSVMPPADVVEEDIEEPESEPVMSEAPDADHSDSVKTDLDDEVSVEKQDADHRGESHTNEGEVSNSPLETAVPDTFKTEAVKSLSISDVVASETDSADSPPFSVEDGEESTAYEEQGGANEALPQIDPPSSADNDQDTPEPAGSVPAEGEQGRSLDVDADEFVQDAETEKFTGIGALDTVDKVAETEGEVQSQSPVVSDGTDTSSSISAEVAEISEAGDALVPDIVNSPQLPIDVEEIAEVQDAPTSTVGTAEEEQLAGAEGEIESPSPTILDAAESSQLASTDGSEDLPTGDTAEEVETTDASQVILSPDTNEVLEVHKELEVFSGMEEVEDEEAVELEVETSSASGAAGTDPLDSADNREAGEEDEATEGREFASTSTSSSLGTEENVEVTSSEQDGPTSVLEEVEEEQAVGNLHEVEAPGGIDPNATDIKSLSADEASGSIDTGESTDVLENANALDVACDADTTVKRDAEEQDTPASATDLDEEKAVETVHEFEPVGETDAGAKSIQSDSSVECVAEGAVTDGVEKVGEPSESSLDATEVEDKTEQDAHASPSEFGAPDLETSVETDALANSAETSLLTSEVQTSEYSEVSETGDATEMVKNDDVPRSFTTDAGVVSEVGRNEELAVSPSDAAEVEKVANIEGDVPDGTWPGLLNSAKIHPEMIETDDTPNLEDKVHSTDLTPDEGIVKEVVDTPNAFISSEDVKDGDNTMRSFSPGADEIDVGQDDQINDLIQSVEIVIADLSKIDPAITSVMSEEPDEEKKALPFENADVGDADISFGDIPQFSSSPSNLIEASSLEKQQELELQVNVPSVSLNDSQISASVEGMHVPETFSTVEAFSEVTENEDLVRQTESSGPEEVSAITEKATVMLSPSTQLAVSALEDSEKEPEIVGTELEVQGLADTTSDISKDSESLKEKIFGVAHIALEEAPGVQELISFVTENTGSPEVEGATPIAVEEPETSKTVDNILQSYTPSQSSTAEEKVIFTTDFKKVSSSTENQEESVGKGDLSYFPSPSPTSEESFEATESTGKLANDRSLNLCLHSSGPSSDPIPVLGDKDVEQKEISGYDNVSVKDIATSDRSVETVKTVSDSMPIASQVEDPLGSHDLKFQSLPTVTLSAIQKLEIFSLNEANVATKMKGDFLLDEENHPLRRQHLFHASSGSTLPSSGSEEDSSSRGVFVTDSPSIIEGGASASTNSPLQLGAQHVQKQLSSVPLSTYSGELNSSWVAVPLVAGSEVRFRPSEENIIEKEMPRLRAVARGGEERRSVSERDVPTASVADGKSTISVPKASTQIIQRDEDSNDSRFPLSVMLWCSQSLSSLFGSAKSL